MCEITCGGQYWDLGTLDLGTGCGVLNWTRHIVNNRINKLAGIPDMRVKGGSFGDLRCLEHNFSEYLAFSYRVV